MKLSKALAWVLLAAIIAWPLAASAAEAASTASDMTGMTGMTGATASTASEVAFSGTPGPADLMKNVPDSALLILTARDLAEGRDALGAFIDEIQPGMSQSLQSVIDMFVNDTGDGGGLDPKGAFAFALVPTGEDKINSFIFMPITDPAAWRAAWGESIAKDEGEKYEYLDSGREQFYFKALNGFVVFSDKAETLDVLSASKAPLSSRRVDAITKAFSKSPMALDASIAALRAARPTLIEDMRKGIMEFAGQMSRMTGQVQAEAAGKAYSRIATDLVTGLDEIVAGLAPSAEGLKIAADVTTVKGQVLNSIFAEQRPVDMKGIEILPASSFAFGAVSFTGENTWNYLTDFYTMMLPGAASTDSSIASTDASVASTASEMVSPEAAAEMKAVMQRARDLNLGQDAVFSIFKSDKSQFAVAGYHKATDGQKALQLAVDAVSSPNLANIRRAWLKEAKPGMSFGEPQVSDAKIDGIDGKSITVPIDYSGVEPQLRGMIEKMFGDSFDYLLAARDDRLYFSFEGGPEALKALMDPSAATAPRIDMKKVQASLDATDGKPTSVIFLSLPDYALWMLSMVSPSASKIDVNIPESPRFMSITTSFNDGNALVNLDVPMEQIRGIEAVFIANAMAQSQSRSRRPAAPEEENAFPGEEGSTGEDIEVPSTDSDMTMTR